MIALAQQGAASFARAVIHSRPALAAILLAIGAAALFLQLSRLINHDTAWYLHATGRLLDGARLYVDIVELNPPLAFYLTVPPVAAARLLGVPMADAFVIYVFILAAGSLALMRRIMRGLPPDDARIRRWTLAAAFVATTILPGESFGQREHLIVVLGLPYLLLAAMRAGGTKVPRWAAAAAGVAGGLAFAIKPPFLVVAALLELYLRAARGARPPLFRAETLALAGVVALYAASIPAFTPEYIDFILPLTALVYGAYESPLLAVLARIETLLVPAAIMAVAIGRTRSAASRLAETFLVAGLAAYGLYVLQMKGWQYHVYPVTAALMLIAVALLIRATPNGGTQPARGASSSRPAWIAALLLAAVALAGAVRSGYSNPMTEAMAPLVRANAERGGLAVFSANVSWGFPLAVHAGADWPLRFPTLWPLPGLARARAAEQGPSPALDRVERYVTGAVIEDLARRPPAVVLVDVRKDKHYFGGLAFDYLEFFGRDPRFRGLWLDYERVDVQPAYHVYRRRTAGKD